MYSLELFGVRLENHLRLPVMWRKQPESMSHMFSKPPTRIINERKNGQMVWQWVSKLRSKLVPSHLLNGRVTKLRQNKTRTPTLVRLTTTTNTKAWGVKASVAKVTVT